MRRIAGLLLPLLVAGAVSAGTALAQRPGGFGGFGGGPVRVPFGGGR